MLYKSRYPPHRVTYERGPVRLSHSSSHTNKQIMNNVFYSVRDEGLLNTIRIFIDKCREKESQAVCHAIHVFITGDAGTGKTMMQDGIKYLPNITPVFSGSTNVAGNLLKKVFCERQYFVNDHSVYPTTFQQVYKIKPDDWKQTMSYLYANQPSEVSSGSAVTANEFFEKLWPALHGTCKGLVQKYRAENPKLITPQDYKKIRRCVEDRVGTGVDARTLHKRTMNWIRGIYPQTDIIDQLIYDTYVIDEGGRLQCSWDFIFIGLYYVVHEEYCTGVRSPVIVTVGSCTQSKVINDTCLAPNCKSSYCTHTKIPINDLSMITMISKKGLLYQDSLMVKNNKHNRRTKSGDPDRSANLALFRNHLEMNEPIPEPVMKYIKEKMSVTEAEFLADKCIHLCLTHQDCIDVLRHDEVTSGDTIYCEELLTSTGGGGPATLYNCSAPAGAMYKSADYTSNAWAKSLLDKPWSKGSQMMLGCTDSEKADGNDDEDSPPSAKRFKKTRDQYSCWTNTRRFRRGRPYTTTHNVYGVLKSITGSWVDLSTDLLVFESLYSESHEMILEFIKAISFSLSLSQPDNEGTIRSLFEKACGMANVDDLMLCLNKFICMMHDVIKYQPQTTAEKDESFSGDTIPDLAYNCNYFTNARLLIPKGSDLRLEGALTSSRRTPLVIRLGKTLSFTLFHSTMKIDQPISKYQQAPFQKRIKKGYPSKGDNLDCEETGDEFASTSGDKDFTNEDCGNAPKEETSIFQISKQLSVNEPDEEGKGEMGLSNINSVSEITTLDLIPLKLNLVSTVAASQGITINSKVYAQIKKTTSAYDLIVMSTRSSSSNDIFFCFQDPSGNVAVTPLDKSTLESIKRLYILSLNTTGFL